MEGGWEEDVRWDLDDDRPTAVVALDMNDPHLIFQLIRPTSATEDLDRAAALVLPAPPKVDLAVRSHCICRADHRLVATSAMLRF